MTAAEIIALLVQAVIFLVGLVGSLTIGILLARLCQGPGELLATTALVAAGLLGAAALSQMVRDRIVNRSDERN